MTTEQAKALSEAAITRLMDALERGRSDALKTYASAHPGSYDAQIALGRALRKEGDLDQAVAALERAAALAPMAAGPDSPHAQLVEIALERRDNQQDEGRPQEDLPVRVEEEDGVLPLG